MTVYGSEDSWRAIYLAVDSVYNYEWSLCVTGLCWTVMEFGAC